MIEWLKNIFLGLLQGIAEFLPISSSGHLDIAQHFMGMTESPLFYNVLLHLATFFSICVVYRKTVIELIIEFFRLIGDIFKGKFKWKESSQIRRMLIFIIIATIPLFFIVPFSDYLDPLNSNMFFIGATLILTAVLLFSSDRVAKKANRPEEKVTIFDSFIIGLGQMCALVPGLSRSGTTISTGIFLGIDREYAVRFSFLMSLPAVAGATILELKDAVESSIEFKPEYLLGMVIAFVSGIFAIKLVNMLVKKNKFGYFAYYCAAVGIITIIAAAILG